MTIHEICKSISNDSKVVLADAIISIVLYDHETDLATLEKELDSHTLAFLINEVESHIPKDIIKKIEESDNKAHENS